MENTNEDNNFDKCAFCVYTLVKLWKSINILYDSARDSSEMKKFKRYLYHNDNNLEEYDKIINNTFSIIDTNDITDYYQIYLYLNNNSFIDDNYDSKKKEYLTAFNAIIKKFISYFKDNNQCELFNMTHFIKNEVSDCFYEMYKRSRISFPRQAQLYLEKSANMYNFKAYFELGLMDLKECNYASAYKYFFLCSDFSIIDPLEICYPPSMFMVGIMYYYGLHVKKDLDIFKKIFEMSSQLNQYHHDNNFERALTYLPKTFIF